MFTRAKRTLPILCILTLAAAVQTGLVATARADISADSADDVCAPSANPCVVSERVRVASRSLLDFGTRTLQLIGDGQFDFGAGNATIESGSILSDTDGPAFLARGKGGQHSRSGKIKIRAFRQCELADRQCFRDKNCDLGDCGSRRCAGNPLRLCEGAGDCSNGVCEHRRCSLDLSIRCDSDADCNTDTCAPGFTCEGSGDQPLYCEENSDCQLGQCSVGDGSIVLGGGVDGTSDNPAVIRMEAYSNITLVGDANVSSIGNGPGGTLDLQTYAGDVNVEGKIKCTGEPAGRLKIRSKRDTNLRGNVECGGSNIELAIGNLSSSRGVLVRSGRDILVTGRFNLDGETSTPHGGYVHLVARRDLTIDGEGRDGVQVSTTGIAATFETPPGFGGRQTYESRRDLRVINGAMLAANGGFEEGFGGVIEFGVDGDALFDGIVQAHSGPHDGLNSAGGGFFMFVDGDTHISEDSDIDVSGGPMGAGGKVFMRSADLTIDGLIKSRGEFEGEDTTFQFTACDLTIGGDGRIDNNNFGGDTTFNVRELFTLADGGLVRNRYGENIINFRSQDKRPRIEGNMSPKPQRNFNPGLLSCDEPFGEVEE